MNKAFIIKVSSVAALGGLLFGFDTAIISGTIPYITGYFGLDEYSLGWAVSSILIGCAIGAALAGKIADTHGRKTVLIICALLFAVSGVGAASSTALWVLVLFRLIGGLGVGAAAMVSPMYIAEIAPAKWRGRLVACYQLAIVTGILLAYYANYLFDDLGENNWRWMFASQAAPAMLFFVLLLLVPESPRWLVKMGNKSKAAFIIRKIAGEEETIKTLQEIEKSFANATKFSFFELFDKKYFPVVCIGILVAVFQQVTGINSILYYAPVIFKETGLNSASSLLQTIGIGFVNVIATFIAIGFVDKVGRKKFLLAGCILMALSLVAVAVCFRYQFFEYYIVLISMLMYVGAFGCTLGAVTWVYLSEIFPNRIRGVALSIATFALWCADFAITYTFPIMTRQFGTSATLLCYATVCAIAFVYMLFNVKETHGRSLEEIETLFVHDKK
jgi:MFS transporter, SP family, arabinose:H+ symporter